MQTRWAAGLGHAFAARFALFAFLSAEMHPLERPQQLFRDPKVLQRSKRQGIAGKRGGEGKP